MIISSRTRLFRFLALIYVLLAITLFFWYLNNSQRNIPINIRNWQTYLGQLTAVSGLIFLSFNYILATRVKLVERFFGGLDKLYLYHMVCGIVAYIFVFFHPLLLASYYFSDLKVFKEYYIPEEIFNRNLGIFAFWSLTILILLAGIRTLPYNLWKLIHKLIGIPLFLGGLHAILAQNTEGSYIIYRLWIIFWIILGVTAYLYKEILYDFLGPVYKYVVSEVRDLGDVFEVHLKPIKQKMNFRAGQFGFISFLNSKEISNEDHPFTITSAPNEENIRISIKGLGNWTNKVAGLDKSRVSETIKLNDKVKVYGPYGFFTQNNLKKTKKQVWIGGGIGIAPFLSLARTAKSIESEIFLFYGVDSNAEAVYHKELIELTKTSNNLKYIYHCLENEKSYMNIDFILQQIKDVSDTVFLMCGPMAMLEAIKAELVKEGVKAEDIIFEYFEFK